MLKITHYEIEEPYECSFTSPCGAYSTKHDYSHRLQDVTCPKCLKALGYRIID